MMMPTVLRTALRGLALGSVVALVACNGVGKGIGPVSSALLPAGGAVGDTSLKAYTCLNTSVALIVDFSNGSRGDFSSRAQWSSSRPDIVKVSDGTLAVPEQDGFFYGRGVLVPVGVGSAVITAKYLDFTNSITVTVANPSNFQVSPTEANLAIGSSQDLTVTADLDGKKTNVDGFAKWAFVEDSTTTTPIAAVNSTSGLIVSPATGVATSSPLTVRMHFPGCALAASTIDTSVSVSALSSLALSKEFAGTNNLVVGTTERITVTGTLDNGKTQELSGQVAFKAVKPAAAGSDTTTGAGTSSDLAVFLPTLRNVLYAAKAGTAPVTTAELSASFSYGATDAVITKTSPVLAITPVDASLTNVTVPRTAADLAPGNNLRLSAVGEYQITTPPSSFSQDITRHVVWSVPEADLGTLTVQSSAAGATVTVNALSGLVLANSAAETGKMVVVTATQSAATGNKSATSTIRIDPTEPQEP